MTLKPTSPLRSPTTCHGYDTLHTFGALTATPSGPSDIHGGAFTLMFESKIRSDGYGVLASEGQAGVVNAAGGHTIVLEAAATYTLRHHFPDPSEVGAYQIVIQPNLHKSQFIGYHANGAATGLPDGTVNELTSQQVALVVGLREPDSDTGAVALVLAEATMADVRGCEVFINELILDHDPDHGSQFTNIPPLMLHNALSVQATESPAFVKRSLPYHPQMFDRSTPGMTTNIPWWSMYTNLAPTMPMPPASAISTITVLTTTTSSCVPVLVALLVKLRSQAIQVSTPTCIMKCLKTSASTLCVL